MNYSDFSNPKGLYHYNPFNEGYDANSPNGSYLDSKNSSDNVTSIFYLDKDKAKSANNANLLGTPIYKAYQNMLKTEIGKSLWDELKNNKDYQIYMGVCPESQLKSSDPKGKALASTFGHLVLNQETTMQANFESFVNAYNPELENFKELIIDKSALNKKIILINYGIEEFISKAENEYSIFYKNLRCAMILFHELYAHIKMHYDPNEKYAKDSEKEEHDYFGQSDLDDHLNVEKASGKFAFQLMKKWGLNTNYNSSSLYKLYFKYFIK